MEENMNDKKNHNEQLKMEVKLSMNILKTLMKKLIVKGVPLIFHMEEAIG